LSEETIKNIDIKKIEEIYRDRFNGVQDFTFFIVGNAPEDSVKMYAEKYIGSITKGTKDKKYKSDVHSPFGVTKKVIEVPMTDEKCTVMVNIAKRMSTNNRKTGYKHLILARVMNLRYTEDIREKEGGTYGVSVSQGSSATPVSKYTLTMSFDTDPEKAEYLKSLIYKGLDSVATNGISAEELDKIKKSMLNSYEQSKPHNSYVMSTVFNYYMNGYNQTDPKNYEEILEAITTEDIQKHAAKIMKNPDIVDLMFVPAK
jgi:zinc protease